MDNKPEDVKSENIEIISPSVEIPVTFLENSTPAAGSVARRTSSFSILVFMLCFLLAIYLIPSVAYQINYALVRSTEEAKAAAARELLEKLPAVDRISWVVKKVRPSVVGVKQVLKGQARIRGGGLREVEVVNNEGSGVIVDAEGYIITNYHVIHDAQSLEVHLSDGRQTERVDIIGVDQEADIAVLKIDLPNLMEMSWGNSDTLEVGEAVLAIGNPYGLFQTVTAGIVSAKERYNTDSGYKLQEFLQTDAAVNPGNSGGPLINIRGELVGINTAIYGEAYQGISFAIPIALVRKIYDEIRKNGEVTYGWLGISMEQIPAMEVMKEGSRRSIGVEVSQVVPNSPAEDAGLKTGDVITNWNGLDIRDFKQLYHTILFTKPESKVLVKCLRNAESVELEVSVGRRPSALQRR